MKISHEVPLVMLNESREFNDYDYALVHLFDMLPEYKNYYYNSLKEGRIVYLDNSLFELGEAFDSNKFAKICEEMYNINKDNFYYIIPDSWENKDETIKKFEEFPFKEGNKIGVVQGKDFNDAVECYNYLKDKCEVIAFSFGAKWYEELGVRYEKKDSNKFENAVSGRQAFISYLHNKCGLKKKKVHLLGCYLPQEFKFYKKFNFNEIISVDTSNPIVHGIKGIKYKDFGLKTKEDVKLVDLIDISEISEDVHYNIKKFREINL